MRSHEPSRRACWIAVFLSAPLMTGQQPPEPVDTTPLNGEFYYILSQLSGLQAGLSGTSAITEQPRSFTDLGQRWAFSRLPSGSWQIKNIGNGLCIDGASGPGMFVDSRHPETRPDVCGRDPFHTGAGGRSHSYSACPLAQNPCTGVATQQWTLTATSNGYYTISNEGTGLLIDVSSTYLAETALRGAATQSQQWLLRPAFFRGVDNALLEKQEAARAAAGLPWWKDAGQPLDVLEMLKDHGVNMVRLRPTSVPPYANASSAQCSGNACYGETDAQDLDLARRAKNLGMSVELTLFFDGGNSSGVPAAWSGDTELAQLQAALYAYVKAEILAYRDAGVMPDLVSIGNEVDTGFLGALGSPTGQDFGGFAALQTAGIQAVKDAAADTTNGPAIPAPLTCIHITPAWDLTQFFTLANQFSIPYDAICQSYYPFFHGPLTDAQAAASNPGGKPVEQDVLVNAANHLGKPIFIIEAGEHYENGFDSNDPWYVPPTVALQRQFLLDLEGVEKGLPNNLGMGIAYWDPAGVNIPGGGGGFINGDNRADAIYIWNGLTLFDNADAGGSTSVSASNYSMLLPGIDALGGKLDSTLNYKFVNRASGQILSVSLASGTDSPNPTPSQQWRITSNNDGYFQIASLNSMNVLSTAGGNVVVQSAAGGGQDAEWNIVSAGGGYFDVVNRASGLVLDTQAGSVIEEPLNNNATTQQWQIISVH